MICGTGAFEPGYCFYGTQIQLRVVPEPLNAPTDASLVLETIWKVNALLFNMIQAYQRTQDTLPVALLQRELGVCTQARVTAVTRPGSSCKKGSPVNHPARRRASQSEAAGVPPRALEPWRDYRVLVEAALREPLGWRTAPTGCSPANEASRATRMPAFAGAASISHL